MKITPSPKCEAAALLRTMASVLPYQRSDLIRQATSMAERLESGRPNVEALIARRVARQKCSGVTSWR